MHFCFSLWVVSTCVLICLRLLMDGFSSLIFIYRFFLLTSGGPKQCQCFSANEVELRGGRVSEFSTLIQERVFQEPWRKGSLGLIDTPLSLQSHVSDCDGL